MSRIIEFRAWHEGFPRKGSMKGHEPVMLFDEKFGNCIRFKADGQPVTLMQYTGLKDRNGKKIFEGDILKSVSKVVNVGTNKPTGEIRTTFSSVEWGGDIAQFSLREKMSWWPKSKLSGFALHQDNLTEFYEIVGNIYEDKHLLEDKW